MARDRDGVSPGETPPKAVASTSPWMETGAAAMPPAKAVTRVLSK